MNKTDDYILLIRVLKENQQFLNWFLTMGELPESIRNLELNKMVRKMQQAKEKEDLINMIKSLNNQQVFFAVLETLRNG